jgi:hypothetical protein
MRESNKHMMKVANTVQNLRGGMIKLIEKIIESCEKWMKQASSESNHWVEKLERRDNQVNIQD